MKIFHSHRAKNCVPGVYVCVNKSIGWWYGHGGGWINYGISYYIVIKRKPENGLEIQNLACRESGIMIRLKLVK